MKVCKICGEKIWRFSAHKCKPCVPKFSDYINNDRIISALESIAKSLGIIASHSVVNIHTGGKVDPESLAGVLRDNGQSMRRTFSNERG